MGVEIVPKQVRASTDPGGPDYYLNGGTFIRETMPRSTGSWANTVSLGGSGVMLHAAIVLYAGDVVTKVGFMSGNTAANLPTAGFFALYSSAATPALIAQSADLGSGAWASLTPREVSLSAPQTITSTGVYYIAVSITATTPPTLIGLDNTSSAVNAPVATGSKRLSGTSGSTLGGTAPATIASPSASRFIPYGWVL